MKPYLLGLLLAVTSCGVIKTPVDTPQETPSATPQQNSADATESVNLQGYWLEQKCFIAQDDKAIRFGVAINNSSMDIHLFFYDSQCTKAQSQFHMAKGLTFAVEGKSELVPGAYNWNYSSKEKTKYSSFKMGEGTFEMAIKDGAFNGETEATRMRDFGGRIMAKVDALPKAPESEKSPSEVKSSKDDGSFEEEYHLLSLTEIADNVTLWTCTGISAEGYQKSKLKNKYKKGPCPEEHDLGGKETARCFLGKIREHYYFEDKGELGAQLAGICKKMRGDFKDMP